METKVDEIAAGIYRISTRVDGITPDGFTFNQFLVTGDEPLLFHCGLRALGPAVLGAIRKVMPPSRLRWISFGHVEADEMGALPALFAEAPAARVVHGTVGCMVSLNDLVERPPLALEDGAVLDAGSRRFRLLATPHVPHTWEAIVLFEETTGTLLGGDVLTASGDGPAVTGHDPVEAVLAGETLFGAWSLTPSTTAQLHRLAGLAPKTIASMHGSSFAGDGARVLRDLAAGLEELAEERRGTARAMDARSSATHAPA